MDVKLKKCVLHVLVVLAVSHTCLSAAAALDLQENCILSFVVPRDKVKSSCDMEERVSRRLNAMETKVTLYKQHVMELQEQLQKERDSHTHRVDELQSRLARAESHEDELFQKRIQALEEEVRKLRTTTMLPPSSGAKTTLSYSLNEKSSTAGVVMTGRTKEEEDKAVLNLVKTVVHSEVKKLFDNYTQYVGRYVRDQALAFNQIISMVPRNDQSFPPPDPSKWMSSRAGGDDTRTSSGTTPPAPPDSDLALLNELEGIRNKINSTGKRLADHVEKVLQNVTAAAADLTTPPANVALSLEAAAVTSSSDDVEPDGSLLDVNDTASGDANDTTSDHNITLSFTDVGGSRTDPAEGVTPKNVHVAEGGVVSAKDASKTAQSRMSHNTGGSDMTKIESDSQDKEGSANGAAEAGGNQSTWEENMVHDQSHAQWVQVMLRTEIQSILQQQVDEVLSLVSKHSAMVDSRLEDQEKRFSQLEERLAADVKHLDQLVNSLKLELTSVSQGVQTLYQRTEKTSELEDTVAELKKNISMEGNSRLLATLLDEQGKKVRKLERLTEIYQQSLEHYRNETKLEYRDLKERLTKESGVVKSLNQALYTNITSEVKQANLQLNTTMKKQIEEVKQRVQVMEDNSLLLQIDLSSFERQLKSKSSKSERDISRLTDDVNDLKQKTRNLQRTLSKTESDQEHLSHVVNSTSTEVQNLKMEVKLNVLDDWLPYNFDYMKSRTDCFGEQFVRKSGFKTGRLVGVVLCSHNRYKIFLGQSLTDTFKNIGDDSGMGEDHCEFVNASQRSAVKVSPFRTSTDTEPVPSQHCSD
nr:hypothetical protein BaRGS_016023 [Batillaria attramentaria]